MCEENLLTKIFRSSWTGLKIFKIFPVWRDPIRSQCLGRLSTKNVIILGMVPDERFFWGTCRWAQGGAHRVVNMCMCRIVSWLVVTVKLHYVIYYIRVGSNLNV